MPRVSQAAGNVNPWARLPVLEGTGEVLEDVNAETNKKTDWNERKVTAEKFAELLGMARSIDADVITEKRLADVQDCASFLMFARERAQGDQPPRQKLYRANFCKHRLCPMCSWRRSLLIFAQTAQVVDAITADFPTTRYIFVTFTIKNCPATAETLAEALDMMNEGFKRLVNKRRGYKAAAGFQKNLLGYMKAVEVTYNERSDTYHPHIHAIFAVRAGYFAGRDYLTKQKWQDIWSELLGIDYNALVMPKNIDMSKGRGAVAEVAKYPLKPADLLRVKNKRKAAEALVGLALALGGRRLTTWGGLFKDYRARLKLQDVEADDANLINADEASEISPVEVVLYRWRVKVGAYVC